MHLNFELILFYLTLICGILALLDVVFWAPKRKQKNSKMPIIIDYARSFFPVLLLVFFIRSFLYEPFRIPTGSLKPTLSVGDFILVNKFTYGVRLPILHTKMIHLNEPKRGDIIVFRWPVRPSVDFIKRVIGVPGDKISYIDKVLYINGKKIPQTFIKTIVDDEDNVSSIDQKEEKLFETTHFIYQSPSKINDNLSDITVPDGMYFVMGDNRDNSQDSRFWGFVPEENIVGKATLIWMSWNSEKYRPRWDRIGTLIR